MKIFGVGSPQRHHRALFADDDDVQRSPPPLVGIWHGEVEVTAVAHVIHDAYRLAGDNFLTFATAWPGTISTHLPPPGRGDEATFGDIISYG